MRTAGDRGDGNVRRSNALATAISIAVHAAILAGLIFLFRHGRTTAKHTAVQSDSSIPALVRISGQSETCLEPAPRSVDTLVAEIKVAVTGDSPHVLQGLALPTTDSSRVRVTMADSLCAAAVETINRRDGAPRGTHRFVTVITVGTIRVVTDEALVQGAPRLFVMDSTLMTILQVAPSTPPP